MFDLGSQRLIKNRPIRILLRIFSLFQSWILVYCNMYPTERWSYVLWCKTCFTSTNKKNDIHVYTFEQTYQLNTEVKIVQHWNGENIDLNRTKTKFYSPLRSKSFDIDIENLEKLRNSLKAVSMTEKPRVHFNKMPSSMFL